MTLCMTSASRGVYGSHSTFRIQARWLHDGFRIRLSNRVLAETARDYLVCRVISRAGGAATGRSMANTANTATTATTANSTNRAECFVA